MWIKFKDLLTNVGNAVEYSICEDETGDYCVSCLDSDNEYPLTTGSYEYACHVLDVIADSIESGKVLVRIPGEETDTTDTTDKAETDKTDKVPVNANLTLKELNLSRRSYNALARAGAETAGDVADLLWDGRKITNFGDTSRAETIARLKELAGIEVEGNVD